MIVLGLLVAGSALVCYFSVSLPASGRVERGGLVGLRTPSTKRSDATWLAAHRAALPLTTGASGIALFFGTLIALDRPPLDLAPETAALVGLGILLGGLLIATVVAERAARVAAAGSVTETDSRPGHP